LTFFRPRDNPVSPRTASRFGRARAAILAWQSGETDSKNPKSKPPQALRNIRNIKFFQGRNQITNPSVQDVSVNSF
jgi:hypothetical protein